MKVLIVDDSAPSRASLCRMLRAADHYVIEAEDGLQGLRALEEVKPEFVLTDLNMPNMDGLRFIVEARKRGLLDCPVGILTGYNEDWTEGVEPQVDFTMHKPLEREDVENLLRKLEKIAVMKPRNREEVKPRESLEARMLETVNAPPGALPPPA